MKKSNLHNTFQHIRQLPLEVSFAQVEQWVKQQPVVDIKNRHWMTSLVAKLMGKWSDN